MKVLLTNSVFIYFCFVFLFTKVEYKSELLLLSNNKILYKLIVSNKAGIAP